MRPGVRDTLDHLQRTGSLVLLVPMVHDLRVKSTALARCNLHHKILILEQSS